MILWLSDPLFQEVSSEGMYLVFVLNNAASAADLSVQYSTASYSSSEQGLKTGRKVQTPFQCLL
jgi:hypothetical protein